MDRQQLPLTLSPLSDRETSPQANTTSKKRFWNKFRSKPKPVTGLSRNTSDGALVAPACPPKPSPLTPPPHPSSRVHPMIPRTVPQEEEPVSYELLTEEMTLPDFAMKYQNNLPQQVVVTHGVYCKENLEVDISSSERLNIHFVRHRESVS